MAQLVFRGELIRVEGKKGRDYWFIQLESGGKVRLPDHKLPLTIGCKKGLITFNRELDRRPTGREEKAPVICRLVKHEGNLLVKYWGYAGEKIRQLLKLVQRHQPRVEARQYRPGLHLLLKRAS